MLTQQQRLMVTSAPVPMCQKAMKQARSSSKSLTEMIKMIQIKNWETQRERIYHSFAPDLIQLSWVSVQLNLASYLF